MNYKYSKGYNKGLRKIEKKRKRKMYSARNAKGGRKRMAEKKIFSETEAREGRKEGVMRRKG